MKKEAEESRRLTMSKKLMVAFPTTTDAMHMQIVASKQNIPGHMIPLPGTIEAGCGLAWCTELDQKETLIALTRELGIRTEGFFEEEL